MLVLRVVAVVRAGLFLRRRVFHLLSQRVLEKVKKKGE
jgi:hypothetical protein